MGPTFVAFSAIILFLIAAAFYNSSVLASRNVLRSASSTKSSDPAGKTDARALNLTPDLRSSRWLFFSPPQAPADESIATFQVVAGSCSQIPKNVFDLGETVCARVANAPLRAVAPLRVVNWSNTNGFVRQQNDVTSDPQEIFFTIASTETSVINGETIDNRGIWSASINATYDNSTRAIAFFNVRNPANPAADLEIYNTSAASTVTPGSSTSFLLWLSNKGPDAAVNVHATQVAPPNMTFNSTSQDTGEPVFTCSHNSGITDCSIATLASGAIAKITIHYTVTSNAPNGVVNSRADIVSNTQDPRTANNSSETQVEIRAAGAPPSSCSLTCSEDVSVEANTTDPNDPNQRGAIVHYEPTVSDGDCGTVSTNHCNDCFFPVGTTVVTTTASAGGSCSFSVIVSERDSTGPTITCPDDQQVTAESGACTADVDPGTPTTTGSNVTVTGQRSDGQALDAPYPSGLTTIVWTATDDEDRTASCEQRITVQTDDTTPPTVQAPDDLTRTTGGSDGSTCGRIIDETALGQATATDNCGTVSVQRTGVPAGNFFPIGTTTITYTATDGAGNTTTDTQTVVVTDDTPPTVTATAPNPSPPPTTEDVPIQDVTVHTGPNSTSCEVVVSDADLGNVQARDNCAGVTLTRTPTGNAFPVGTTTIVWTATDASGNTGTATQNVTVIDDTQPTITAPSDVTVGTGPNRTTCDAEVSEATLGSPTADDNCSFTVTRSPSGSTFPLGTTTVTWTITDASGNSATATQQVTVVDDTAPVITCPSDVVSNSDSGSCSASNVNHGTATATDNCSTATVNSTRSDGQPLNAPYPQGTTTITWTATDEAGNSASCTQTVTVNDNENPTISCPANMTVYVAPNSTDTSAVVNYTAPVGQDNCGGSVTTQTAGLPSGSAFPVGTTTNTFRVTDASGHTAECSFTVTVLYNFSGFFSPVNNPPVLNTVNAGRTIPVKFSLSGNKGLNIFAAANSPASGTIPCDNSAPASELEETSSNNSSLSYSAGSDTYTYHWKSESAWAGTCRQLVVTLNDGSSQVANFKFR